jgi:hypothetical protein
MAKGPRGERRPAGVNARAVMIAKIATGEVIDPLPVDKNPAAQEFGRKGGQARAKSMSARRRKAIAKKAAQTRWR